MYNEETMQHELMNVTTEFCDYLAIVLQINDKQMT